MSITAVRKVGWMTFTFALALMLGQACQKTATFSGSAKNQSQGNPTNQLNGNGDSYGGKPTIFVHSENNPCSEKGANGQPLPKNEIFVFSNNTAQLVRENCIDLDLPLNIPFNDLTFTSPVGPILYQGKSFQMQPNQGDFSLVAASCPSPMVSKPSAKRTNLMLSSQVLTDTSVWFNHIGIGVGLNGSLASLFRYQISRNSSVNLEYWRRIHQSDFPLSGGTPYVYSFLVEEGNLNEVNFILTQTSFSALSLVLNISSGQVVEFQRNNIPSYSVTSYPVGKGRFFSVYFSLAGGGLDTVIGITPNGVVSHSPAFGDFIYGTAIQLEEINNFCQ